MLPAKHRLTKRKDFDALFKRGKVVFGQTLQIRIMRQETQKDTRLAVVVSAKTEKSAVRRNRAKRQAREVIRQLLPQLHPGFDAAITLKAPFLKMDFDKKQQALTAALTKAKLIG